MRNVTLAIGDELLAAGREYARQNRTTLNKLIRAHLEQLTARQKGKGWLDDLFELADQAGGDSKGNRWKREDLYDV